VCGHYGCGGVERALGADRSALVDHWLQPIVMLYRKHRSTFDAIKDSGARAARMCEINVQMQVRRVAAIPSVENAWARGQTLHVHGWVYGMHDGLLRDVGPTLSSIADRDALPSIDDCVLNEVSPLSALQIQALEAFCDRTPDNKSS